MTSNRGMDMPNAGMINAGRLHSQTDPKSCCGGGRAGCLQLHGENVLASSALSISVIS